MAGAKAPPLYHRLFRPAKGKPAERAGPGVTGRATKDRSKSKGSASGRSSAISPKRRDGGGRPVHPDRRRRPRRRPASSAPAGPPIIPARTSPAPGRREIRRRVVGDRRPAVGRRDNRVGAFEHNDRARSGPPLAGRGRAWRRRRRDRGTAARTRRHAGSAPSAPARPAIMANRRRAPRRRRSARLRRAPLPHPIEARPRRGPPSHSPTPSAGPMTTAFRRSSARISPRPSEPSIARIMIAVRCAAWTASASGGEATVTSPAPTRSAPRGGEARRTGARHRPRDDNGMAAVVFVSVARGQRNGIDQRAAHCERSGRGSCRARRARCRCRRR